MLQNSYNKYIIFLISDKIKSLRVHACVSVSVWCEGKVRKYSR